MLLYNIIVDGDEPVFACGAQYVNDKCIRILSRYYVFHQYRTDGRVLLDKLDSFEELEYTLGYCNRPLVFCSRTKSPALFNRLKNSNLELFKDWEVYPTKLRIIYPDNNQYIFYKGDINEIS
jgi:hypothetical protein